MTTEIKWHKTNPGISCINGFNKNIEFFCDLSRIFIFIFSLGCCRTEKFMYVKCNPTKSCLIIGQNDKPFTPSVVINSGDMKIKNFLCN